MRTNRYYKYEIVKKKAIKIERLRDLILEKQREVKIKPHMKNAGAFWNNRKEENIERKRTCVICGKTAAYIAYFQIDGAQLMEKYCSECVDKGVYLDQSFPSINK